MSRIIINSTYGSDTLDDESQNGAEERGDYREGEAYIIRGSTTAEETRLIHSAREGNIRARLELMDPEVVQRILESDMSLTRDGLNVSLLQFV
jgi:hypothetical protein